MISLTIRYVKWLRICGQRCARTRQKRSCTCQKKMSFATSYFVASIECPLAFGKKRCRMNDFGSEPIRGRTKKSFDSAARTVRRTVHAFTKIFGHFIVARKVFSYTSYFNLHVRSIRIRWETVLDAEYQAAKFRWRGFRSGR